VIIGDANLAETATYLKWATTALILDMIESGIPLRRSCGSPRPGARGARHQHDRP